MAVDVAGDVAVTMFARRGVHCTWLDTHVLVFRDGQWALLGGGGGSADEDLLTDRPLELPASPGIRRGATTGADARIMVVDGGGGVLDSGGNADRWPWSGRWISYATVRVSGQVTSGRTSDRDLPVPWHGRVVVAWTGRRRPRVVACDESGHPVATAVLTSP
jgi:hypothetical protein